MTCIINAESGTGLTNSADGSGLLKVQSGGKTTNALAWVNFNGTGTVAIRSSYNVSSITDNMVGDYTVNFATALSDANYCVVGSVAVNNVAGSDTATAACLSANVITTSSCRAYSIWPQDGVNVAIKADAILLNIAIFGN